jgi:hypothetical protein
MGFRKKCVQSMYKNYNGISDNFERDIKINIYRVFYFLGLVAIYIKFWCFELNRAQIYVKILGRILKLSESQISINTDFLFHIFRLEILRNEIF